MGDTPYPILGPGGMVDPYPFVAKDGRKTKRRSTIDHYEPAAARPPRGATIVALVGGAVKAMRPDANEAGDLLAPDSKTIRQIAPRTDDHTESPYLDPLS